MSSALGSTFTISRSTGTCSATGRLFEAGERYVATLVERPGQPFLERLDFSWDAWERGARPVAPLRLFGVWRATMLPPDAKKQTLLSDPELLELFEELGGAMEPRQQAFRYLLALLLVRRRVLKMVRSEAGRLLVQPKTAPNTPEGATIEVIDPGLTDEAIAQAIEQLGQVVAVQSK